MKFSGINLLARRRNTDEKKSKYVTPSPIPILKHALSRPIMNRFQQNFQELVSQEGGKE